MKKIILIILLLSSCTNYQTNKENNINDLSINFSDNLSIEEFKIKLEEYSYNNPYPNIDN